MPNILKQKKYEGVVGVACGPEVVMSGEKLAAAWALLGNLFRC